MLALILQSDSTPMAIGSSSGWLMFAGMIIVPLATSERTSSGGDLLLVGDEGHLFSDEAFAGEVHLAHVGVAGASRFHLTLNNPLAAWGRNGVVVADCFLARGCVITVAVAVQIPAVTVRTHAFPLVFVSLYFVHRNVIFKVYAGPSHILDGSSL